MTISPIGAWHRLVANKDVTGVDSLLAEKVLLRPLKALKVMQTRVAAILQMAP